MTPVHLDQFVPHQLSDPIVIALQDVELDIGTISSLNGNPGFEAIVISRIENHSWLIDTF